MWKQVFTTNEQWTILQCLKIIDFEQLDFLITHGPPKFQVIIWLQDAKKYYFSIVSNNVALNFYYLHQLLRQRNTIQKFVTISDKVCKDSIGRVWVIELKFRLIQLDSFISINPIRDYIAALNTTLNPKNQTQFNGMVYLYCTL